MTFQYNYDSAMSERVKAYTVSNMLDYVSRELPAALAGAEARRKSKTIQAPDWLIEKIRTEYYKAAPHLMGQLPRQWCCTTSHLTLQDSLTHLYVELPDIVVPNGVYINIQPTLTIDELKSLGLFDEQEREYKDMRETMAPLHHFISSFQRCVPVVVLQRHPWIIERFPKKLLDRMLDNYTKRVLSDYRKEFDALPPRKDRKPSPDVELLPALQFLDMIKLQEH